MAGQQLTTTIVINARTGNGFSKVGSTLTELGTLVNGFSQELISLGTDSVKVYRDYEKSLQDARVALSTTYGRDTQELAAVMQQLDATATEWAATTIFHTNDVANAISEAAHAGWDLDQIMTGMPAAMQLAQAGSMDLSESVNYIVKASNAAGISMEDMSTFIDLWTFAANSSASTVEEFGEAMLRMGSTMRFAASPEELMTLIAVTANAGAVGTEAGTMIRNSMMRLVAPTDKANKALTAMGATTEELAAIAGDENLAAAYENLVKHGFHGIYDESGQMRSVLDVYSELAVILGDMAGGMDNIANSEEAMQILSAIFPTRTITEALNLLTAASNNYDGLYDKMTAGAAEGYGAYAAETMMDTLNGDIEIFNSKVERLKQVIGGQLKGQVEDFAGFAGEIVDSLAEMDPDAMSALIKGLEVVAAAGPALLLAGGAFRLIGAMMTPAGLVTTGVLALAAGAAVLMDLSESKFADNFGTMDLDGAELRDFLSGLDQRFSESRKQVDQWRAAVEKAAQSYESASSTLSSKLTSAMITGATLTEEDYNSLSALVDQMFDSTEELFEARAQENIDYWGMLFHYDENNPYLQEFIDATTQQLDDSLADVQIAGDNLHNALFKAISNDGKLTPDELEEIQSYVRAYNDAVAAAMAADEERRSQAAISAKLHKAQSASLDAVKGYAEEIASARDELLATEYDTFLENYYYTTGLDVSDESLAAAEEAWKQRKAEIIEPYNAALLRLYGTLPDRADLSWDDDARMQLMAEEWFGGQEGIWETAEAFRRTGNTEAAERLEGFVHNLSQAEDNIQDMNEAMAKGLGPSPSSVTGSDAVAFWNNVGDLLKPDTDADMETVQELNETLARGLGPSPSYNSGDQIIAFWNQVGDWLDGLFNDPVEVPLDGNFDGLDAGIAARDGQSITVYVDEQPSGGSSHHSGGGFSGRGGKFAHGGRATEASIFGEGDVPEWAIPEEHSARTAELLNAARAASGFTWPDLLARFGGLNANPANSPTTFVYSPVIHANDASGVEAVLRDDKARMEHWFEERRLRDGMEVYA